MTFAQVSKVKDFSGQSIYVGIDVHFKSWSVSIYSDEFELKTFNQPPEVNLLVRYLQTHYPGACYQLGYEAGFCGFWIQREFARQGIECMVIHPPDLPGSDKEKKRKTDRVDSRRIAKGLKNKMLTPIFIPDEQQESDRLLIRSRGKIVQDLTKIRNRIKALLKFKGIVIPGNFATGSWSQAFIAWLNSIDFIDESSQKALRLHVREAVFLLDQRKDADASIKELSGKDPYKESAPLLLSVPSIGLLTAMTLLTEIGNIKRFRNIDHLSSFCGLAPNCRSSGQTERVTGISRRGNRFLKTILIECSWIAIKKDPALLLYYKQLIPRMNGNKAIIKVARKLLCRISYVLKQQQSYVTGIVA